MFLGPETIKITATMSFLARLFMVFLRKTLAWVWWISRNTVRASKLEMELKLSNTI
jgi:hypothetical protein